MNTTGSSTDTARARHGSRPRGAARGSAAAAAHSGGPGRRLLRAAEALLVMGVVVAPWAYGGAPDPARYGLAALVLVALALWAAARARSGAPPPALARHAAALPLLAVAQAVSGTSADPWASAEAALLLFTFLGVAVFWSEQARSDRRAGARLATAVLTVAALQGIFGAVQQSLSPGRIYGRTTPLVTSPFASYVNHNHFAGLAGMAALLAAGWAWGHLRRARAPTPGAVGMGGLAVGLIATLLASRSRGGLIALVGGLATLVALRAGAARLRREERGRRALLVGAGAVLLGGVAAALMLAPAAARAHLVGIFTGVAGADTSSAYRLDMARATLRLAGGHVVWGAGFGAFADALTPYKTGHGELRTEHAESDVLELTAEGGLAGLGLIALSAAFVWRRLRERLQHGRDAAHTGLVEGAVAALVGLCVHSLFDFNLRLPANALIAASLLGLVAAGRAHTHAPALPEAAPRAWRAVGARAWLGVALPALLALASAWRAQGAWLLERALVSPAPQQLGALDQVTRRHPYLAGAWRARGLAWRDAASPGGAVRGPRLARAERDLAVAVRLRPGWGEAWADLGWVRFARGDRDAARADLDRAARLDPSHIGIGVARAAFNASTGNVPEALRQLARTLEANPEWGAPAALQLALTWTSSPEALSLLTGSDPARLRLVHEALARRRPPAGDAPR